ncbi:uncharacterized protein in rpcF 3'region-like isoform X2 [Ostrea edulis]|uniref:uncharacterized protein in rpcF 3'region-like isoform X2 n=1 Tax=Ostrea edulis TaxID=37623 RepID=UPI0024AED5D8|nr:uncharacterized protein in rpcF 3'region-like isoform X2 [Ostrea edulis]
MDKPFSVLFVCLGNTCRSTMSEGIFHHLVKSKGLQDQWNIDSAGIANWHEGKPPDEFTVAMLQRNNMMDGYHHRARQSEIEVFEEVYTKCLRCCQRFLESQTDQLPRTEL